MNSRSRADPLRLRVTFPLDTEPPPLRRGSELILLEQPDGSWLLMADRWLYAVEVEPITSGRQGRGADGRFLAKRGEATRWGKP